MIHHGFYRFLSSRSGSPFPGIDAHERLLPRPLDSTYNFPNESADGAHPSSVLIPLYPAGTGELNVILTLRTENIRHAGQISFPGGRSEMNEELIDTALRETHEEIGVKPDLVSVACSITPLYLHRSNNKITPFVGFLDQEPGLTLNPNEVEEAFNIPLRQLMDEKNLLREIWDLNQRKVEVPYWNIHPTTPLWGATAMILSELLELYDEFLKLDVKE
jgi:8-oxo-dGTP pyrophosphatase MutT (NUDIX family)